MSDDAPDTPAASTRSAATVGAGLGLLAISASAFLVLAARATGPERFAGLAVLWTLVYTVGIGLFLAFEQEVARAVSDRAARGEGARPVVARATAAAALLFAVFAVASAPLSPWLVSSLFNGSWTHYAALLLASAGLGAQYVQRGLLAGSGAFASYSAQMGSEGLLRLFGCVALLAIGTSSAGPFAILLAAAPLLSVLVVARRSALVGLRPGPAARWSELTANVGWLICAALAAQGLANLGTVAVKLLADPDETAAAGHFLAGFTVARLPLLMFAAVQAVLLPSLVRHLAHGRHVTFRRQLRTVMVVTGSLGLVGVVGSLLLGPEVLRLLFGSEFRIERTDLAALSVGVSIYMLALVLQPAVIALGRHRGNAIAWLAGLLVFAGGMAVPASTFVRVELALALGSLTVTALLGYHVRRHLAELDSVEPDDTPTTSRIGLD